MNKSQDIKQNHLDIWSGEGNWNRFQSFQDLMRFRIRDILLVSSLYDLYLFEEDGRLYELIRKEYHGLNLSHSPELTRVSSGRDAINIAKKEKRFDLIITTLHIEDMHAIHFAKLAKKAGLDIPIILLALDNRELKTIILRPEISVFDNVFLWTGDYRLILGIIKYLEDKLNVEHDSKMFGVQNIILIEDAAESLGSLYREQHTGTFGKLGVLSFNGNKTITTGGGGMILTDDEKLAKKAKHLTTQAKVPHKWNYVHDMIGYNYRLTNLAAALGVAQLEQLPGFIENKRGIAKRYREFFENSGIIFVNEPENAHSNFWLSTILFPDKTTRDNFLEFTNNNGIMTRPAWELMNRLPMFKGCQTGDLTHAEWLADRVVNIPSSVI